MHACYKENLKCVLDYWTRIVRRTLKGGHNRIAFHRYEKATLFSPNSSNISSPIECFPFQLIVSLSAETVAS